jgi:fused signal recognition particle receptor
VIVTKLDGSGKGGIVVAIQDEFGIPTRFVGTGETTDDFAPFDAREFLANML